MLNDARAAGVDSPMLFGYLPRQQHEELRQAIASHLAAQETLEAHGPGAGPEANEARKAIETLLQVVGHRILEVLGLVIGGPRSSSGVGRKPLASNWPTRSKNRLYRARLFRPEISITLPAR